MSNVGSHLKSKVFLMNRERESFPGTPRVPSRKFPSILIQVSSGENSIDAALMDQRLQSYLGMLSHANQHSLSQAIKNAYWVRSGKFNSPASPEKSRTRKNQWPDSSPKCSSAKYLRTSGRQRRRGSPMAARFAGARG